MSSAQFGKEIVYNCSTVSLKHKWLVLNLNSGCTATQLNSSSDANGEHRKEFHSFFSPLDPATNWGGRGGGGTPMISLFIYLSKKEPFDWPITNIFGTWGTPQYRSLNSPSPTLRVLAMYIHGS
jgi:hypothetical protein